MMSKNTFVVYFKFRHLRKIYHLEITKWSSGLNRLTILYQHADVIFISCSSVLKTLSKIQFSPLKLDCVNPDTDAHKF